MYVHKFSLKIVNVIHLVVEARAILPIPKCSRAQQAVSLLLQQHVCEMKILASLVSCFCLLRRLIPPYRSHFNSSLNQGHS